MNAFAALLLKLSEATVFVPSRVTLLLPVCAGLNGLAALLNVATAPGPLGMVAGFQLAVLSQVPPVARFQVTDADETVVTVRTATPLVALPAEVVATTV